MVFLFQHPNRHMAFFVCLERKSYLFMEERENSFMKTRPVFSLLISMSVPMMLSMLIQSLYNIVDSIYVSRLGTDALTAVSLAYPLQNAIVSVGVGIGVGISSAISICLGRGDQEGADRSATIGVALTVFHCILFILLGIFVTKPFLSLFTDSPKVLSDACDYTYIVLCVSFGSLLQIAFEKIFQGIGQIGAFLLYIVVYLRKPYAVRIHPKYLKFDRKIIRQIYSVGIPSSIMMLLPSVLISILNSILAAFSEIYVAVLGVYFKLQTFIYMPANGIVQGMRPIIGYNYGAGEEKRVRATIRYSLVCAAALMLTGTLLSLLIPGPIFSLFDADEALMSAGITALRIICLGFLVSTIGVIYSGTFEALGNGRNSLIISLLRQFVITIPLSFILSRFFGAVGVWISFPVGELCASIVAFFLLQHYEGGKMSPFSRRE